MLFRQPANLLVNPADNHFKYNDDYASVMQFISKNKTIPAKLAEVAASALHQQEVDKLLKAITDGDLRDAVLSHPYLEIYILQLLKEQRISILDFLTLKIYDHALMQHSRSHELNTEDSSQQDSLGVVTVPYTNTLELFVNKFLEQHYQKHIDDQFDMKRFAEYVLPLSKLHRNVICIRCNADSKHHPFIQEFARNSPFVVSHGDYYLIPSAGIMQALLKTFNEDMPIKMAPIYGTIGLTTLFKMHQKGFHPINLYSPNVKSNPVVVHGEKVGPLNSLLHDMIVHTYWGNYLQENQFRLVHDVLMPIAAELFAVTLQSLMDYLDNPTPGGSELGDAIDFNYAQNNSHSINTSRYISFIKALRCIVGDKYDRAISLYRVLIEMSEDIKTSFKIDIKELFTDMAFLSSLDVKRSAETFLEDSSKQYVHDTSPDLTNITRKF